MRILVDDTACAAAIVELTLAEASELERALADLIARFDEPDHRVHVTAADMTTLLTLSPAPTPDSSTAGTASDCC